MPSSNHVTKKAGKECVALGLGLGEENERIGFSFRPFLVHDSRVVEGLAAPVPSWTPEPCHFQQTPLFL